MSTAQSVTISVTPSFASKWLVTRLPRFVEQYPDIDLRVEATERLATFSADGIDIAIRQGDPPFGKGLKNKQLAPLDLCAICKPGSAEDGQFKQIEDFRNTSLIQDGHRHWDRLCAEAAILPEGRMIQFNQTALAMDAAANGQGFALVPWLLAAEDIARSRLAIVWRPAALSGGGYHLVYPDAADTRPFVDAVIGWVQSEVSRS